MAGTGDLRASDVEADGTGSTEAADARMGRKARGAHGLSRRDALGRMVAGALAAAAGTALTAFGGGTSAAAGLTARRGRAAGVSPVSITVGLYQSTDATTWAKIMKVAIPLFEKSHRGITINFQPAPTSTNLQQKLITMYAAGVMPDIIQDCCADMPVFASQGMLVNLMPYITKSWPQNWKQDFLASQINALYMDAPYNAGQFALPTYCGTMVLYYNAARLKQHHVAAPDASWTFADYAAAFEKISAPSKRQWGAMLPWVDDSRFAAELLHPYGARLVDAANNTKCAVDTKQGVEAVTWYYDQVYRTKSVVPFNAGNWGAPTFGTLAEQGIFGTGLVGFMGEGSWLLSRVVSAVGNSFPWNVAPPPLGPAGRGGLSTTDGYGISSKSKHPEEAWQVLSWMTGDEFSKLLIDIAFLQPARKSLIPYYQTFARQAYPGLKKIDLSAFTDGITLGWATPEQLFRYEAQAMLAYSAVMSQSLWSITSAYTPAQICHDLATQIDASQIQAAAGH